MAETIVDFNKPCIVGKEYDYMADSIRSSHISGDGKYSKLCHEFLENKLGIPRVLTTPSCSHALELSALLLNIQPGDEVIIPDFTFVSTVNAFVLRGAKPVFIDIRSDTLNLDESQLERLITEKTKAIVPVHYAGIACEMDTIMEIAGRYNIPVVEDNAHGLFGKYKNRWLGTIGCMATQSFHETKNFTCGEGGALLINDRSLIENAEIIREKGTNRSRFFRGQVDKYTWVSVGSSYLLSDILAGFLYAQLEVWEEIQAKRKWIWQTYHQELSDWAKKNGIVQPTIPENVEPSWHIYYLLLPDLDHRQGMISHLKANGVNSVFHYLPLHLSEKGREYGGREGDMPVTESVSDRLVRLPLYYDMGEIEMEKVLEAVISYKL
ncbi:dTDP-4-amino-4,6-dideoxygalactose transaminase [Leptolinea sp. HRD-7]|nr:dTDP-4-amino-4,6-dideoxygalactose transaminase [Leptolinea sp. HRD-7]